MTDYVPAEYDYVDEEEFAYPPYEQLKCHIRSSYDDLRNHFYASIFVPFSYWVFHNDEYASVAFDSPVYDVIAYAILWITLGVTIPHMVVHWYLARPLRKLERDYRKTPDRLSEVRIDSVRPDDTIVGVSLVAAIVFIWGIALGVGVCRFTGLCS